MKNAYLHLTKRGEASTHLPVLYLHLCLIANGFLAATWSTGTMLPPSHLQCLPAVNWEPLLMVKHQGWWWGWKESWDTASPDNEQGESALWDIVSSWCECGRSAPWEARFAASGCKSDWTPCTVLLLVILWSSLPSDSVWSVGHISVWWLCELLSKSLGHLLHRFDFLILFDDRSRIRASLEHSVSTKHASGSSLFRLVLLSATCPKSESPCFMLFKLRTVSSTYTTTSWKGLCRSLSTKYGSEVL